MKRFSTVLLTLAASFFFFTSSFAEDSVINLSDGSVTPMDANVNGSALGFAL